MSTALVLQEPTAARGLFLLFHGVGATEADLRPLGGMLAQQFPQAAVVSVRAPDASDLGAGWQWFSVRGVTEENRPDRVAATLPRFAAVVHEWQQRTGTAPATTTLIGFSQGAILSLASSGLMPPPAHRIVSLSGRFDALPSAAPQGVRFHFLHGESDPVIASSHASSAAARLQSLGAAVTLDLFPGLGHGISPAVVERLGVHLSQAD